MAAIGGPRRTIKQLFFQAYNEIPEVIGGSFMALIGLGFSIAGIRNYYAKDLDNRKYKNTYIVMRPDDPRAVFVHKDHLEKKCD